MTVSEITIDSLTTGALNGTGVFDALMRAAKVHLDGEFNADRIRGPEYSTVYLGQLESSMSTALNFLATRQKIGLEAQLLELQVELAGVEIQKANATLLQIEAQTELIKQQKDNAAVENAVLMAQECKLRAEYDLTLQTTAKAAGETALLAQKHATERAQVLGTGVDEDSVVGRQKRLYQAQTDGFTRDAEQKTAKLLIDTWSARRMSDDGTQVDGVNKLDDATIGRAVTKLLAGVGA